MNILLHSLFISLVGFSSLPKPPAYEVIFFLGEDCIISQNYTDLLRRLHDQYQNDPIQFVGYFPNPSSTPHQIKAFQSKYDIPFPLHIDQYQVMMDRYDIKVTPEVVVLDPKGKICYQGRIDNRYFRVGKRRTITTTHELSTCLEAIVMRRPITVRSQPAIGCFISPIDPKLKNVPMCNPDSTIKN